MANTPYGARLTTKLAMLVRASEIGASVASTAPLFSRPISASPIARLNSTTAGTTVSASERKGLAGIYIPRKSNSACSWIRLVVKNEADSQSGKATGMIITTLIVTAHNSSSTAPTFSAS